MIILWNNPSKYGLTRLGGCTIRHAMRGVMILRLQLIHVRVILIQLPATNLSTIRQVRGNHIHGNSGKYLTTVTAVRHAHEVSSYTSIVCPHQKLHRALSVCQPGTAGVAQGIGRRNRRQGSVAARGRAETGRVARAAPRTGTATGPGRGTERPTCSHGMGGGTAACRAECLC